MGEGQGEPWLEYEKRPLPRDFTHPLGQSEVRDALTAAGVYVGRFGRSGSHGQNWWDMEAVALHAHRYGDDVARAWGPHDPVEQVGLAVPGCPSQSRRYVPHCSGQDCPEPSSACRTAGPRGWLADHDSPLRGASLRRFCSMARLTSRTETCRCSTASVKFPFRTGATTIGAGSPFQAGSNRL